MKLIIGLGNIGEKYLFTRHNVGFMLLDKFALANNLSFKNEAKLKCSLTKYRHASGDVLFIKPSTFMNLSGEAMRLVIDYYKIMPEDILVIYDDIALDVGKIRFRSSGSDGGHNGIKSIIKHLGTNKFDRLKIGIGPQPPIPAENYVLQNFSKEQMAELKDVLVKSIDAVEYYLINGIEKTQNYYN